LANQNSSIIILIPHYNDAEGLLDSLISIQENIPLDAIVVDDGSIKKPEHDKLQEVFKPGRVYLELLPENTGIEYALNAGLKKIQQIGEHEYVGRLDCGDTCLPGRFEAQLDFLTKNPTVKLLGTQVNYKDGAGKFMYASKFPTGYQAIRKNFYINSMIVHPSVVFSISILDTIGYYPTNYHAAEDYAYFMKVIQKFETRNLADVFVEKVIDDKSISTVKWKLQVKNRIRVIWDNFYFGWYPVYGLIRNCILYLFPRTLVSKIKLLRAKL